MPEAPPPDLTDFGVMFMPRGSAPRRPSRSAQAPSEISVRRERRRDSTGRRSDTRWQQILAGSARAFAEFGYAQATLEDVAAQVGINRATLYYYVGTKEELLVALLREPIQQMRATLEQIVAGPEPAPERLAKALGAYASSMIQTPELFIFLKENVHEVMAGPEADEIRANADRYGRCLSELVADGVSRGEFRADLEPLIAVLGIIGMFNWIHRWYDPKGPRPLSDFTDAFIDMALRSVVSDPRPR
jgi:AcrR family transcriptional regulator